MGLCHIDHVVSASEKPAERRLRRARSHCKNRHGRPALHLAAALRSSRWRRHASLSFVALLLASVSGAALLVGPAQAQGVRAEWREDASTAGGSIPGTTNYNADANWYSGATPPTQARFGYTDNPNISFSSLYTFVGEWRFKETNPSGLATSDYTFTVGSGQTLEFSSQDKLDGTPLETGILVNGGSVVLTNNGLLRFLDATSADANRSGAVEIQNNGVLLFMGESTGGLARIINNHSFHLDSTATPGVEVGSIEGNGGFFISDKNLITGGNNLSTVVTGEIVGTGGSLTKIGTGTLTLSGANTYSGGTRIDGGIIRLGANEALGTGGLQIGAGGTFDLDGYTQTVTVLDGDAGSTIINSAPTVEPGDPPVLNASQLTVGSGNFSGSIIDDVGFTSLIKTGPGTLTLSGMNTYVGGTRVAGGTLALAGAGSIATSPSIQLDAGTTFDISQTDDGATIGGLIETSLSSTIRLGSVTLTIMGTGSILSTISDGGIGGGTGGGLIIDGGARLMIRVNTYTGATVIRNGGTLLLGSLFDDGSIAASSGVFLEGADDTFDISEVDASIKTLQGPGQVYLGDRTLTITDASTTFSGIISDGGQRGGTGGGLTLENGTLTLNGQSDFTGPTNVIGGTLIVGDAAHSSASLISDVFVRSGATIAGHGAIGALSLDPGGTIAPGSPGNAIGTLTVNGDMTFAPGATYAVDLDPASGDSDLVHVTGVAHLGDALVIHVGLSGTYDQATTYTILTADNGLDGSFDDDVTTETDLIFLEPVLSYDDNNVYLNMQRNGVLFSDFARTRNQRAAAAGAESLGTGNPIYGAILGITNPSAFGAIFDALSGEVHASVKGVLIDDSRFVREAATDRVRAAFSATNTSAESDGGFATTSTDTKGLAVWSRAFGSWGQWPSDGNAATLDRTIGGLFVGADGLVAENVRLGVIAGHSYSNFDVDARASSGKSRAYHLGGYGGSQWGALGLRFGAAYSWHNIETDRVVAFPGFFDSPSADYDAATAQAFGELGYRIDTPGASLEPFVGLAYVNLHTDGFTENGGAAALASANTNTNVTFTTIGVRTSASLMLGATRVNLHGTLGWRHAFGDTTPLSRLSFAGSDAFTIAGVPIGQDAGVVKAGIDLNLSSVSTLGLSYDGQFSSDSTDQSVRATLSLKF